MRASSARGGVIAAGSLGLALGAGCLGGSAFLCESDDACQQEGVSGLCQPSGYCSFPDDACPSGQRYGDHAGGSLAGVCVDASHEGTGSSSDGGGPIPPAGTSTSTSGVDGPMTTEPPTSGVDGPVTTEPVGESDGGTTTGPTTTGVGEDDPGTSTGEPAQLVCWTDEFDDRVIDPMTWCTYADPGVIVDEPLGHLRLALIPAEWVEGASGAGWAATCDLVPLLGATASTEVLAVPQASPFTEAFIELRSEAVGLGLGVLGGQLYAFEWNGMGYAGVDYQPYDPAAHHFLRVLGTAEGLVAESSFDGVTWNHVYTERLDLGDDEGWAALGTWAETTPLAADESSFERFELCWLE